MSERPSTLMPARLRPLIWPLIALAALLLFNGLFTEGFARITIKGGHVYGSLVDILKLSSLGMTLIIATAGVDLSVGAVVAIAGSVAAKLIVQQQIGLPMALAATSGLCLVLGAWNGTLVGWLGVQPIVATLILMVAGRGIAQLLAGGQIITVESSGFSFIAGGHFLGLRDARRVAGTQRRAPIITARRHSGRGSIGDDQSLLLVWSADRRAGRTGDYVRQC